MEIRQLWLERNKEVIAEWLVCMSICPDDRLVAGSISLDVTGNEWVVYHYGQVVRRFFYTEKERAFAFAEGWFWGRYDALDEVRLEAEGV